LEQKCLEAIREGRRNYHVKLIRPYLLTSHELLVIASTVMDLVSGDSSDLESLWQAKDMRTCLRIYKILVKIFGLDICQKSDKDDEDEIARKKAVDKLHSISNMYTNQLCGKHAGIVDQSEPLPKLFRDCYKKSKSRKPYIQVETRVYPGNFLPTLADFVILKVIRIKVQGEPTKQRLCVQIAAKPNAKPESIISLFWSRSTQSLIGITTSESDKKLRLFYQVTSTS
jgi:hypothetical protein